MLCVVVCCSVVFRPSTIFSKYICIYDSYFKYVFLCYVHEKNNNRKWYWDKCVTLHCVWKSECLMECSRTWEKHSGGSFCSCLCFSIPGSVSLGCDFSALGVYLCCIYLFKTFAEFIPVLLSSLQQTLATPVLNRCLYNVSHFWPNPVIELVPVVQQSFLL